jgi:hypothetical protein
VIRRERLGQRGRMPAAATEREPGNDGSHKSRDKQTNHHRAKVAHGTGPAPRSRLKSDRGGPLTIEPYAKGGSRGTFPRHERSEPLAS